MDENELIYSANDLYQALTEIGIQTTDSILIQADIQAFGIIPGKEQSIVTALKKVVAQGNIVSPAFSLQLQDPSEHYEAGLADKIKAQMPAYDPQLTPAGGASAFSEYFRSQPNTSRDNHPLYSFAAWGKDKEKICTDHSYDLPFGQTGVLGRLYDLNSKVVLLGTNFETCVAIHFAESEIGRELVQESAPIMVGTEKRWIKFNNVEFDKYDDFEDLGTHFLQAYPVNIANLPAGQILVFNLRDIVSFARDWFEQKDRAHQLNAGWKGPVA
ncbi:aminoglycoside N(3)-acetyltransferase [Lactobacillus psittaci]|uniref:Aminoglycoside N(3)-acetyltransferase n=1 Tax=Lactobacillus psittaci DSM 15354 TaxID=1122152 RepID=A0A0R1SB04_9LACO|nr:AAC(3) family N-acetyltransferase [Lactobacillus psittaci]KRL63541.1 aminoglycoside N(3)-acetyltransferase [Lactobacillus psittaci DSM 15354]